MRLAGDRYRQRDNWLIGSAVAAQVGSPSDGLSKATASIFAPGRARADLPGPPQPRATPDLSDDDLVRWLVKVEPENVGPA